MEAHYSSLNAENENQKGEMILTKQKDILPQYAWICWNVATTCARSRQG